MKTHVRELVSIPVSAPPDEVLERLRLTTGPDGGVFAFPDWRRTEDILSRVVGNSIRLRMRELRVRRRPTLGSHVWHNSWAPLFYGRVESADGGSILTGHFDIHPGVRWFEGIWAGGVTLAFVFGGIIPLAMGDVNANHLAGVTIPPAMLCALFLMHWLGRRLGQDDEKELLAFLEALAHQPVRSAD